MKNLQRMTQEIHNMAIVLDELIERSASDPEQYEVAVDIATKIIDTRRTLANWFVAKNGERIGSDEADALFGVIYDGDCHAEAIRRVWDSKLTRMRNERLRDESIDN